MEPMTRTERKVGLQREKFCIGMRKMKKKIVSSISRRLLMKDYAAAEPNRDKDSESTRAGPESGIEKDTERDTKRD